MEAPDFWDNAEISQKKMKELKSMKDDMETYQNLVTQKEDMETLIEMSYEENDPSMIEEIQEMLDEFQAQFDSIRVKTLLSGEYDGENAIIKLNAGAGGTEACDWCSMLYRMYTRYADRNGFSVEVLDMLDGDACVFEKTALVELANKGELMSYIHEGFWQCMDNIREKNMLENLLDQDKAPWKRWDRQVPSIEARKVTGNI